jgi:hypothetical protein
MALARADISGQMSEGNPTILLVAIGLAIGGLGLMFFVRVSVTVDGTSYPCGAPLSVKADNSS